MAGTWNGAWSPLASAGQGPGRSCAPRVDSVTVLAMTMATFASMGAVLVMAIMAPTEAAFMTRLPAALASVMEVGTGRVTVGSPAEMRGVRSSAAESPVAPAIVSPVDPFAGSIELVGESEVAGGCGQECKEVELLVDHASSPFELG